MLLIYYQLCQSIHRSRAKIISKYNTGRYLSQNIAKLAYLNRDANDPIAGAHQPYLSTLPVAHTATLACHNQNWR